MVRHVGRELCGRVDLLLLALHRHRQRSADLLWQAYQTDLGEGHKPSGTGDCPGV
jgi:hypothetical protein